MVSVEFAHFVLALLAGGLIDATEVERLARREAHAATPRYLELPGGTP